MKVKAMRGHAERGKDGKILLDLDGKIKSGGELLFYWLGDGPHLILYREWKGDPFEPGEEREVLWLHDNAW